MKGILTPPEVLSAAPREYVRELSRFVDLRNFPNILLESADYMMVKAGTPADFGETARAIQLWATETTFLEIDWRFVVAAHLLTPIAIVEGSQVEIVELMEAKSPDGTVDYLGAEYVQFYYPDFNEAGKWMDRRGIDFQKRTDGAHRWWNVPLNDRGQELRISDKPVEEIIGQRLADGRAKVLPSDVDNLWPRAA